MHTHRVYTDIEMRYFLSFSILLNISAFNVLLLHCILYGNKYNVSLVYNYILIYVTLF